MSPLKHMVVTLRRLTFGIGGNIGCIHHQESLPPLPLPVQTHPAPHRHRRNRHPVVVLGEGRVLQQQNHRRPCQ